MEWSKNGFLTSPPTFHGNRAIFPHLLPVPCQHLSPLFLLLSRWKGIFAWLPVETIVKEHQQEHYDTIARCDAAGESTLFIEFMLGCAYPSFYLE